MAEELELDPDGGYAGNIAEAVHGIAEAASQKVLGDHEWNEKYVERWINEICEENMAQLLKLDLPYKWMVTVSILQKYPKYMGLASSVSWENNSDGVETCIWPNMKRKETYAKSLIAITQIWAIRF